MQNQEAVLLDALIAREGGYVDHPADRGGPTNWGITQAVARANGYSGEMRQMPRTLALDIYRRQYWTGPGFDQVARVSPLVAAELFDTGVNMGPAVAVAFLQRALNALNRGTGDPAGLVMDGYIGAVTIAALAAYSKRRGAAGHAVLVKALDALQGERYIALTEQRPANAAFVYGWLAHRIGQAS
ncbi:glycoside hydrolase family 108 protein [Sphingomonas silueang]|uniref:glycoside hydrolase family 108 protein n=1 Tax=Sphingomonas silueang TaxID=3156617 RepID=UPI0032B49465